MTGNLWARLLFAIAALLLLAASVALVPSLTHLGRSADLVEHSYQAVAAGEQLLSTLKDAETGQRGYLLTGRAGYLSPYTRALPRIRSDMRALVRLATSPDERQILPRIRALVAAKLAELRSTIDAFRSGNPLRARSIVMTDEGLRTMDQLRAALDRFDQTETRLLAQRRSALDAAERRALIITFAAAVSGACAALVAAFLIFQRGRRTEQVLAGALENMAEGFAVLDSDFRFIAINRAGLQLDARPRSAVLGKTHWEAYPGSEASELGALYRRAAAERVAVSLEHEFAWPDGRSTWLEMRAHPLPDGGLAVFYRDVTERRRAQEIIRAERQRYAAAFDNAAVGMAEVGLDGRFRRTNRTLREITGYAPGELEQTDFQAITHPEDLESDIDLYRKLIAGQSRSYAMEKRYVRKDGSIVPVQLTVGLVRGADGEPLYAISVIEDIAQRKAAEEEVRRLHASLDRKVQERTADLATANTQLEAFSYTVSHDLRAPLRGMEGFARILLDDYAGALGAEGRRLAQRIVIAAERMERLIADLLTFSRLQRAELSLRSMDPTELVKREAGLAREAAAQPGARIAVAEPIPPVMAEPVVLGQVMTNLLDNAIKFHRTGEAPDVRVWGERRGGRVRIWVADRGIGIAPEHQEKVFGAFERLHGQEAFPGTGIGLAIVRTGMERMAGTAGVESELGRGAAFWIELGAGGDALPHDLLARSGEVQDGERSSAWTR